MFGVTGCSNSSYLHGKPWHQFLSEDFGVEVIDSSSCGAGNEMNIEKIKFILENYPITHFIVQLTEPSRYVVGVKDVVISDGYYLEEGNKNLHNPRRFNDSDYYTFNNTNNDKNFIPIFGKNYKVDEFFLQHVFLSDYNLKYKVFHTMMTIQQLCTSYGVDVLFFSWFVDIEQLAIESGYSDILKKMKLCSGYVEDFARNNNIENIPGDGHYTSEGHKRIYYEYIKPFLIDKIN